MATITTKGAIDNRRRAALARSKDKIFGDLAGLERVHLRQVGLPGRRPGQAARLAPARKRLMLMDLRETGAAAAAGGAARRRPRLREVPVGQGDRGRVGAAALPARHGGDLRAVRRPVGEPPARRRSRPRTASPPASCGSTRSRRVWPVGQRLQRGDHAAGRPVPLLAAGVDGAGLRRRHRERRAQSCPRSCCARAASTTCSSSTCRTPTEREEIIRLYFTRYLKHDSRGPDSRRLVGVSDGFAGSDIEAAVHEVAAAMLINERTELDPDFMLSTFVNTSPLSRTNPEQIEEIRAWGRERAVPAGATAYRAISTTPDLRGAWS